MPTTISLVIILFIALTSVHDIGAAPLNSGSAIWHKITKRDTGAVGLPIADDNNKSNGSLSAAKNALIEDKTTTDNEDELIETRPDSPLPEAFAVPDEKASVVDAEQSTYNSEKPTDDESYSNSDRSIDWQLLSGNPADLERELESRRRRRSVRSSPLSRQHRIRTTEHVQRSRSKRDTYYSTVNPSDLLAAYSYLQAQRQQEEQEAQAQSQLGDVNDGDLSNLATLIYELQRAGDVDAESPVTEEIENDGQDQQVLPSGYEEFEPTNEEYEPEIRISPEQLAALEQVLSEQQGQDEGQADDDDPMGYYPKDKRSMVEPMMIDDGLDQNDEGDVDEEEQPTYLIPTSMDPSTTQYLQIPLAGAYENPYNFYQTDDDQSAYEDALRRFDEEQLRQRIASLVDDINEQRQIARRRRRR